MIYLGADHGGYQLKEKIKEWLGAWGYEFTDMGNIKYDREDDYPEFAFKVAEKVAGDEKREGGYPKSWSERSKGILVCRSGGGIVIAANKVRGGRAVGAYNTIHARHAREHNDANILAVSGDYSKEAEVQEIIKTFLETEFTGEERHRRRIEMIENRK